MNSLRDLVDSLGSFFSNSAAKSSVESFPARSSSINGMTDSTDAGTSNPNERTAYKLEGYFDLSKEEIAKALRAEEWGLVDDAIVHYNIALHLLVEALSLKQPPSSIASRERDKVKCYHQKILKWQCHVSDRLQTLSQRTAVTSTVKSSAIKSAGKVGVSSVIPNRHASLSNPAGYFKKDLPIKSGKNVNLKANEASVGYDTKLVEMVNTMIVDGRLSVRWNDINGLENAKQTLMEMVILPTKRRDLFTGLRKPPRA